jgi:hypothetical protein
MEREASAGVVLFIGEGEREGGGPGPARRRPYTGVELDRWNQARHWVPCPGSLTDGPRSMF